MVGTAELVSDERRQFYDGLASRFKLKYDAEELRLEGSRKFDDGGKVRVVVTFPEKYDGLIGDLFLEVVVTENTENGLIAAINSAKTKADFIRSRGYDLQIYSDCDEEFCYSGRNMAEGKDKAVLQISYSATFSECINDKVIEKFVEDFVQVLR